MNDEDFPFIQQLITSSYVFFWSLIGYILSLAEQKKEGTAPAFRMIIWDIILSCGAGMITYLLMPDAWLHTKVSAALIAISGHMGTRALFLAKTILERFYDKSASVLLAPEEYKEYNERHKHTKSKESGDASDKEVGGIQ